MCPFIPGEDVEVETSPKQRTPESRKKDKQMIKTPTDILQNKIAAERMKTPNEKQGKNKSLIEKQRQNRTPNEKQQQKDRTPNEKQQQKKNKTPSEKQQQKNKTPNEKQQQGATPKSSPGTQVNVTLHYAIILQPSDTFTTQMFPVPCSSDSYSCIVIFSFLFFTRLIYLKVWYIEILIQWTAAECLALN